MGAPTRRVESLRELLKQRTSITPGPRGYNDDADPSLGTKYLKQFSQINRHIGKRRRSRAVTNWAIKFFQSKPDTENIAKALTAKVDQALLAIGWSRMGDTLKTLSFLDLTNWGDWWRRDIDKLSRSYLNNKTLGGNNISYRIPREVAVAIQAVEDRRGRCEEHALLTMYLLTIGHMVQNTRFGCLQNDIYYCGAATEDHAFAIVVKGAEFKHAILEAKRSGRRPMINWFYLNTKKWGKSAWRIDGYGGKAQRLADLNLTIHYSLTQSVGRRNPYSKTPSSDWDLTVKAMVDRVSKDYKI